MGGDNGSHLFLSQEGLMKCWWWFCMVCVVLCASVLATAQQPANTQSDTLNFENGVIAQGVYSNPCLGFSLQIPAGWEVTSAFGTDGKAKHISSGKDLALLYLRRQQGLSSRIIVLNAWDASGPKQYKDTQDFVSSSVRVQINSRGEHRELIREAHAVDYGGKHFIRSDYKTILRNGLTLYLAYDYTEFRGYFIGETLESMSPEGLEEAANSLQGISFQEDQVNPRCAMGPGDVQRGDAQKGDQRSQLPAR